MITTSSASATPALSPVMVDTSSVSIPVSALRTQPRFMSRGDLMRAMDHLLGAASAAFNAGDEEAAVELFLAAMEIDDLLE